MPFNSWVPSTARYSLLLYTCLPYLLVSYRIYIRFSMDELSLEAGAQHLQVKFQVAKS